MVNFRSATTLVLKEGCRVERLQLADTERLQTALALYLVIARCVVADLKLTIWGCGKKLGLVYAISPRLSRYTRGLREPREILIRFSLYQRM